MIKAVIFDCFGVLAGSSYREIYQRAGGDLVKDRDFLDNILASANAGFMSSTEMQQQVADRLGLRPEVWEEKVRLGELPNGALLAYVSELKQRGYKTAVLSNANVGTLQRKFSPEQLSLFDALVVSAEVHVLKPDPRIYELAAERLSVETNKCVFTDDNPNYAEAATQTGMKGIHYVDFQSFKAELEILLGKG